MTGPGGHAWEDAEVPSAVHHLARVVTSITSSPRRPGTSVNVGRIGGGEGINLRAAEAWFDLDLRADDPDELAALAGAIDEIARQAEPPLVVEQEPLGERPAGRIERDHPLVRAAEQALDEAAIPVSTPPTSTDANAAHARGIPAIAVGVTKGSGEHTRHEWIETGPIEIGVQTLARTIERFGELSA